MTSQKCERKDLVKSFGIVIVDQYQQAVFYPVKAGVSRTIINSEFKVDSSQFLPGFNLYDPRGKLDRHYYKGLVKLRDEYCKAEIDSICYYRIGWIQVEYLDDHIYLEKNTYETSFKFNSQEFNFRITRNTFIPISINSISH